MKFAVIGAGMSGLTVALRLLQAGHEVTVYEQAKEAGGLASGFKDEKWDWPLERHYHHIFATDDDIQKLAKEIGVEVLFYTPKSSFWINDAIVQMDSPASVLSFPYLSWQSKLRLAAGLAFLKTWPRWQDLDGMTAEMWIKRVMGMEVWEKIWGPLFKGKFGKFANEVSATWFWSRIHARTQSLGYFGGGFQALVDALVEKLSVEGAAIYLGTGVEEIKKGKKGWMVRTGQGENVFDQVIVAGPGVVLKKLVKGLPESYTEKLGVQKGLGAVTLVLAMKESLLTDGTYWLNVNQEAPFLAAVEHTNMVGKEHYGGDRLLYVGNYLETSHEYFGFDEKELLGRYEAALKKINPKFEKKWVRKAWVFKAGFAQPIVLPRHAEKVPSMETPLEGLWWISMEHVFPWDRGTNFAVKWGEELSGRVLEK